MVRAQTTKLRLVRCSEPLFLVDDDKTQVLVADPLPRDGASADHNRDRAVGEAGFGRSFFRRSR